MSRCVNAVARAAHAVARWYDDSVINRGLTAAGSALALAASQSLVRRILMWDTEIALRDTTILGAASRIWSRIVGWVSGWLAPALDDSLLARAWQGLTGWLNNHQVFRSSLAVRLLAWFFTEGQSAPRSGEAVARQTGRGIALLQGLTVILLHAVIWTVPVIAWAKILILLLAVFVLVFVRWLAGEKLRGGWVFIPVLAYTLFATVATATSIIPYGSMRDLGLLLGGVGVLFALINVRDRQTWFGLLGSVVSVATLVSAYGLYQYVRGSAIASKSWFDITTNPDLTSRVFSTFGNPNILAEYLELSLPLAIGLFWSERSRLKQALYFAMCAVMLVCFMLTMSRGGWVALALGALVFFALMEPRALWAVPVGAVVAFAILPPVFRTRVLSIGTLQDASNAYRFNIWVAAIYMIRDLWPTGVGLGYRAFMPIYNYYRLRMQIAFHAHNFYLEQFAELGIIGFVFFLWMLFRFYAGGARGLSRRDPRIRAVTAGAIAGLAGTMLHGVFEPVFYLPTIIAAFWIAMGLMTAGARFAPEQASN